MPRKPHDIVHINLRLPESLRGKIERAAKKHHVSINNEMRLRLEDSFEKPEAARRPLSDIVMDMEMHWGRYADRFLCLDLAEQLANAVLAQDPQAADLARWWLDRVRMYHRFEKEDAS
jgi:hypothetical protein